MRPVQEWFGDRLGKIRPQFGHRLFRRDDQACETEAYRLQGRRVFLGMLDGLGGVVVMDRPVVLVVVIDALVVVDFVHDRCCARNSRQAAVHGEAIQGQA